MNKNIKISLVLVGISQFSLAQIKEERLIFDRKREPEVKENRKEKNFCRNRKNYPPKEKEQEKVEYKITNVPAVSDLKLLPLKAKIFLRNSIMIVRETIFRRVLGIILNF
jgi:hypothetical protein